MRPNWFKAFLLSLLLLVLAGGVYWFEYKHTPEQEEKENQSKKLFDIGKKAISSIEVKGAIHHFKFKCATIPCKVGENSKWEITYPQSLPADTQNVNSLLSSLNNTSASELVDLKTETPEKRSQLLKDYSLDSASRERPEARKIEITLENNETQTLYLGATHPIGAKYFTLRSQLGNPDENTIPLAPSFFNSHLDHDLTYWRDKKLFSIQSHQVESFILRHNDETIEGHKKDNRWTLHALSAKSKNTSGHSKSVIAGDIEAIDQMISGAIFINAKSFVDEQKNSKKSKAELSQSKGMLDLKMQDIQFKLYQKTQGKNTRWFATVSNLDPLYEVDGGVYNRLNKSLSDLRLSKLITSLDRYSTKDISFSGNGFGDTRLDIKNHEGNWIITPESLKNHGSFDLNSDRINQLLEFLSTQKISRFLTRLPPGELSGFQLDLRGDDGQIKRQLSFWKTNDKVYARDLLSPNKNEAAELDTQALKSLPWSIEELRKTKKP